MEGYEGNNYVMYPAYLTTDGEIPSQINLMKIVKMIDGDFVYMLYTISRYGI